MFYVLKFKFQETPIQQKVEDPPKAPSRRHDPIYEYFFKMLDVGVPEQAVRLKMQLQVSMV